MLALHEEGLTLDQILKKCRAEYPESMLKITDVSNTINRGRGDDLPEVHRMILDSVREKS